MNCSHRHIRFGPITNRRNHRRPSEGEISVKVVQLFQISVLTGGVWCGSALASSPGAAAIPYIAGGPACVEQPAPEAAPVAMALPGPVIAGAVPVPIVGAVPLALPIAGAAGAGAAAAAGGGGVVAGGATGAGGAAAAGAAAGVPDGGGAAGAEATIVQAGTADPVPGTVPVAAGKGGPVLMGAGVADPVVLPGPVPVVVPLAAPVAVPLAVPLPVMAGAGGAAASACGIVGVAAAAGGAAAGGGAAAAGAAGGPDTAGGAAAGGRGPRGD